jgi:cystathionine beta-lyase family protein involved in aluminum resistance
MGLKNFFNKSVVIRRLETVSGYKKNFVATGTIDAHIQRLTDEDSFQLYGALGGTHKLWCDVAEDIQAGDRMMDPDGEEYDVIATNKQDYGCNVHLEVILKKYHAGD